jgi:hypothetical protein
MACNSDIFTFTLPYLTYHRPVVWKLDRKPSNSEWNKFNLDTG